MNLIGCCLIEGDGSHLGLGNVLIVLAILEAIQVELVHRSLAIIAGDLRNRQAIVNVLVNHREEVAVVVVTHSLAGDNEVALVVVELEADKVIPTRDDHAGAVARCMESRTLLSYAFNLIFEGVAVLVLWHFINHLSNNEGVVTVVTRQFVAVDVIELNALGLEQAAVAVLIDEIDGINLGHLAARHLVKRGNPSQCDIKVQVVGVVRVSRLRSLGIQGNPVDTDLGCISGIVVGVVSAPHIIIGGRRGAVITTMSTTRCRILIGVSITTINKLVGIGSIVAASGSVPPQQAVVRDKEVKAREREMLSVGIARQ